MRFLQSTWFPVFLGISTTVLILTSLLPCTGKTVMINSSSNQYKEGEEWTAPDENEISYDSDGDLIRYGKELIVNTSKYLGPNGIVTQISNGMNCQNCHLDAGKKKLCSPAFCGGLHFPKMAG